MIPDLLRRYDAGLVDAIESLINRISIWEDGQFSASEVELTRREAQKIAAWVINDAADPFGFCGSSLTGHRLVELLGNIRGGSGNGSV
ncbi:hypothetical protein [Trichormus variabilis]|uniref:Uncharacterized protein n=1 Tax=Trichormus variabilis SAG 1403-4b TaxID=447716 RepID=A0A433UF89_ANAVA|nr:hypothetical protein [Trichormus variabilis]MBD2629889.1 hypothetical protein [Trichormus variabilis FACHB-164]RUS92536.1 hypothetical protein DSM107003_50190 [Trichormus variabilis SAG 1403-4b]